MTTKNQKEEFSLLKGYNLLLYFAGSMIMYEPVEECVVDFWSNGILKALPVKSNNPRFIDAASKLRHSHEDKNVFRERLREDYNRLLNTKNGTPLAPPQRSFYTSGEPETRYKEQVTDFYNSYGWKRTTHDGIPDNNLGIKLLFLTKMIDKYISFDDAACRYEMRNEITRFIRNHLLSWIPEWNQRMQNYASTISYKGIASLIYACCEDICDIMDNPVRNINSSLEIRN